MKKLPLLLALSSLLLSSPALLAQDDPLDAPLDDLPEAEEEPEAPPPTEPPAEGEAPAEEEDPDLADIPEQAPPPGGGLLKVEIGGTFIEMKLKGPDGKYYTQGRLAAGRYVLGIRYSEKEDWERYTFDLEEGREMMISCDSTTKKCSVKSREWKL